MEQTEKKNTKIATIVAIYAIVGVHWTRYTYIYVVDVRWFFFTFAR